MIRVIFLHVMNFCMQQYLHILIQAEFCLCQTDDSNAEQSWILFVPRSACLPSWFTQLQALVEKAAMNNVLWHLIFDMLEDVQAHVQFVLIALHFYYFFPQSQSGLFFGT